MTVLGPLMALYTIAAGYYVGTAKGNWGWFSYHPAAMLLAFVGLAGNAIVMKKVGGLVKTRWHGYIMSAAALVAAFGWYVIYSNKDMFGKPHATTWHAWLGIFVMINYFIVAPFIYYTLSPDIGIMKGNKTLRWVHKWSSRATTGLAWVVCVMGWRTMQGDNLFNQAVFGAPLLLLAPLVLLDL